MSERALLLLLLVGVGCGDDGGGSPDGGPPDGAAGDECTRFVVRGAVGGDGSEGAPHGTLDEAVAAAVAGEVICVGGGELAPPTTTINVPLTIRGSGSAEAISSTFINGAMGGCRSVSLLSEQRAPTTDRVESEAALVADAAVTLESLVVGGCATGVAAVGVDLSLDDVRILNVFTGAHVEDGRLSIEGSIIRAATMPPPYPSDGPVLVAAFVSGGETVVRDSELIATAANGGLWAFRSVVDLAATAFEGGLSGFYINGEPSTDVVIGPGTVVRNLRGAGDEPPRNVIAGVGTARVDGLDVAGSEGLALVVGNSDDVIVRDVRLESDEGLYVAGANLVLEGTNSFTTSFRGLVVSGSLAGRPADVEVAGELTSRGAQGHLVLIDFSADRSLEVTGSVTAMGGEVGLASFGAGSTSRIPGAFVATTQNVAGVFVKDGMAEIGPAELGGGNWGLLGEGAANVTVSGASIADATRGIETRDTVTLTLGETTVEGSVMEAVVLRGGAVQIAGGRIADAGGTAIVSEVDLTVDGTAIEGNGGGGIETQSGGSLAITNATLDANVGAALVFRDGGGSVQNSTFTGSVPDGDGRADEILLEGSGTDGDSEVTVRANNFDLTTARTCTGDCSVFLASGPGAVGIVMPNCLRASPAESSTFTLVDQDGATFMNDPGLIWTGLNAGAASGLGLAVGSAVTVPTDAAMLDLGARADVFAPPAR